jgi:2-haloacid dehalogenase
MTADRDAGMVAQGVRALALDIFGTVVDWRSSIVAEGQALGALRGVQADWEVIADQWRARYQPALDAVNRGRRPWANLDDLHRETLAEVLAGHGLDGLAGGDRERLVAAWHRLRPWPDAHAGLALLRRRFVLATLSNGHVALLVDLTRQNELRFDAILSTELAGRYKPDPTVYRRAVELLGLEPAAVMMVAAHLDDLAAARAVGLRTALVHRPLEHGPARRPAAPPPAGGPLDLVAADLIDLARLLDPSG